MGKKLTEDFIRQITEQTEKLEADPNLDSTVKQLLRNFKLFVEDFYSELETLKYLEKLIGVLIIVGSIALTFLKL